MQISLSFNVRQTCLNKGQAVCLAEWSLCGCSIYIANNNSNAAMLARLTNCVEQTTQYVIEFPVNLAVLATVFDLDEIADVRGDEVFPQEQIPRIPSIEVSKDFEVNINRDYAYSMDLKQVLKQASSNRPISPIRRRALATWHIREPEDFFSVSNVIALLSIGIAMAACLQSWGTQRSMRVFKASVEAMAALQNADIPVAHAFVDVQDEQMDKVIHLFGEMQNEAAEQRQAYVKLGAEFDWIDSGSGIPFVMSVCHAPILSSKIVCGNLFHI